MTTDWSSKGVFFFSIFSVFPPSSLVFPQHWFLKAGVRNWRIWPLKSVFQRPSKTRERYLTFHKRCMNNIQNRMSRDDKLGPALFRIHPHSFIASLYSCCNSYIMMYVRRAEALSTKHTIQIYSFRLCTVTESDINQALVYTAKSFLVNMQDFILLAF